MLVLSRKVGQRILIGDQISVTVVRVGQGGVRIGIDAPSDLAVVREELATGSQTLDAADPEKQSPRAAVAAKATREKSLITPPSTDASLPPSEPDESDNTPRVLPR